MCIGLCQTVLGYVCVCNSLMQWNLMTYFVTLLRLRVCKVLAKFNSKFINSFDGAFDKNFDTRGLNQITTKNILKVW